MSEFLSSAIDFNSSSSKRLSTQIDWVFDPNQVQGIDVIHGTITSFSSVSVVFLGATSIAARPKAWDENLQADINALKIVANFQRKYINYQATYNAFLLGALTEEEFDSESNAYMSEERKADPHELAPTVMRLRRLLEFNLTDRELGEYLEVDSESMQGATNILDGLQIKTSLNIPEDSPANLPKIR